jgi:hypothetical protein
MSTQTDAPENHTTSNEAIANMSSSRQIRRAKLEHQLELLRGQYPIPESPESDAVSSVTIATEPSSDAMADLKHTVAQLQHQLQEQRSRAMKHESTIEQMQQELGNVALRIQHYLSPSDAQDHQQDCGTAASFDIVYFSKLVRAVLSSSSEDRNELVTLRATVAELEAQSMKHQRLLKVLPAKLRPVLIHGFNGIHQLKRQTEQLRTWAQRMLGEFSIECIERTRLDVYTALQSQESRELLTTVSMSKLAEQHEVEVRKLRQSHSFEMQQMRGQLQQSSLVLRTSLSQVQSALQSSFSSMFDNALCALDHACSSRLDRLNSRLSVVDNVVRKFRYVVPW